MPPRKKQFPHLADELCMRLISHHCGPDIVDAAKRLGVDEMVVWAGILDDLSTELKLTRYSLTRDPRKIELILRPVAHRLRLNWGHPLLNDLDKIQQGTFLDETWAVDGYGGVGIIKSSYHGAVVPLFKMFAIKWSGEAYVGDQQVINHLYDFLSPLSDRHSIRKIGDAISYLHPDRHHHRRLISDSRSIWHNNQFQPSNRRRTAGGTNPFGYHTASANSNRNVHYSDPAQQRPAPKTHYTILKIHQTASAEEIKKAFRQRAVETHPDKGGKTDEFLEVKKAYEVLGNVITRTAYDATLNMAAMLNL